MGLAQGKAELYLERIEQVLQVRHLPEYEDAYKVATAAEKDKNEIKRELGHLPNWRERVLKCPVLQVCYVSGSSCGPYMSQRVVTWSLVGARRFVEVPPLPSGTGAMNVEMCGRGNERQKEDGGLGME